MGDTNVIIGYAPRIVMLALVGAVMAGCSGKPNPGQATACRNGIDRAYKAFSQAESEGFGGAVDMTKAAGLLSAAKVQEQFEKYPNCLDKVKRARFYINKARKG